MLWQIKDIVSEEKSLTGKFKKPIRHKIVTKLKPDTDFIDSWGLCKQSQKHRFFDTKKNLTVVTGVSGSGKSTS